MPKPRKMYVEQKSEGGRSLGDWGPATITEVTFSKSGKSIYYHGKTLERLGGKGGAYSNYFDIETRDEYWVSGVKQGKQGPNKKGGKNHPNRHPCGGGPVIEE